MEVLQEAEGERLTAQLEAARREAASAGARQKPHSPEDLDLQCYHLVGHPRHPPRLLREQAQT